MKIKNILLLSVANAMWPKFQISNISDN